MIQFHTQKFEGPLEVLLSLIEEKKFGITEVALAEVTEQYLAYVRNHRDDITLENLAGFLTLAARLILMKSKALLPFLVLEKGDTDDEGDLTQQLEEYKKFADATSHIERLWVKGRRSFVRTLPPRKRQIVFMPPALTAGDCAEIFRAVLADIPSIAQLDQKQMRDVVAIEERIMMLARTLEERGTVAFSEFVKTAKDRSDIVVSFLALLELVKQNAIIVQQETNGADMTVLPVAVSDHNKAC